MTATRFVPGYGRAGFDWKLASSVDGALEPVDWAALDSASEIMATGLEKYSVDLVVGIAGRGIIPAVAVGKILGKPVQIAYKNRLQQPDSEIIFSEPHSRAVDVYLYLDSRFDGSRIALVDDEVTTGTTVANAARELRLHRAVTVAALAVLVNNVRGRAAEALASEGVDLLAVDEVNHAYGRIESR